MMGMAPKEYPKTNALRCLLEHGIAFEVFTYQYEEHGGTRVSSRELGVDEHRVVKTLVLETDAQQPLIVLMHGDCEVSTKQLARLLNVKSVAPCDPKVANRHSGYLVGGTSPFGTKRAMPIYCEAGILELDKLTEASLYLLWFALALAVISGAKQVYDALRSRRRPETEAQAVPPAAD